MHTIHIQHLGRTLEAAQGDSLLSVLRQAGLAPEAPCGGNGSCGKCKVLVDGKEVLACQTVIRQDLTVTLPAIENTPILTHGIDVEIPAGCDRDGFLLAFDIGTTTLAGYLLEAATGKELACESMGNPQTPFGADVISRIRHALNGQLDALKATVRKALESLTLTLCEKSGIHPDQIRTVSIVGNPAMQQLFLGIPPDNLAQIPFAPVLTTATTRKARENLPVCKNAELWVVPDISGFVGADTVAGILATGMAEQEALTLLVDIGTNGEMVLGNKHRLVACSTAAGPALEGAGIQFGMRAQAGAIDHVWLENSVFRCSVLGGGEATGICGSGLIDAVAAALDKGALNERGKILNTDPRIRLTDTVFLTQEDIRQLQLAKGAIAAGIEQMAAYLGVSLEDIQTVYLAGAFGTYMCPASACRIGLLPAELEGKIVAAGNAAGSGAKLLASSRERFCQTDALVSRVEFLELAALPDFPRSFARNMRFDTAQSYWCKQAIALGFSHAASLNLSTLQPRQDVRDMCAADKCGAYGKNWTCPPHCGTLEQCAAQLQGYSRGILLQTVGQLQKAIDTRGYRRTEEQHLRQFAHLCRRIRAAFPQALCLGSGGCRVCGKCAFPDPCRFPEDACASMEAYGLFVTQVCRDNGLAYHHGERTVTYTACILF